MIKASVFSGFADPAQDALGRVAALLLLYGAELGRQAMSVSQYHVFILSPTRSLSLSVSHSLSLSLALSLSLSLSLSLVCLCAITSLNTCAEMNSSTSGCVSDYVNTSAVTVALQSCVGF